MCSAPSSTAPSPGNANSGPRRPTGIGRSSPAYQPATQFGVLVAFHHLAIRALAGQATTLTGADLRDPWSLVNELALTIVKHHGAISTATALDRHADHDLANRLIAWFASDADDHTKRAYASVLAAVGHTLPSSQRRRTSTSFCARSSPSPTNWTANDWAVDRGRPSRARQRQREQARPSQTPARGGALVVLRQVDCPPCPRTAVAGPAPRCLGTSCS